MPHKKKIHLSVDERRRPNILDRQVSLDVDGEAGKIKVKYEIHRAEPGDPPVLDGLVQGVLFYCMKRGLPLRIHGALSGTAFRNLHELQRIWSRVRPDVYTVIDLVPDEVVSIRPSGQQVIQAYSTGVDANFTLVSNKFLHSGRGGLDVRSALLCQGFDISYENTHSFERLVERASEILDHFDISLELIRTNSKELGIQSWMDSHSAQLAACLHQLSGRYGTALISSGPAYDRFTWRTGSNPISDPLLSGDLMKIVHDGAGFSRTEKVEAIADFPKIMQYLKVCWEGKNQHENCGGCEKCMRTRLNFAAVGHVSPSCFPGSFESKMLKKLLVGGAPLDEYESILSYLYDRQLSKPWAKDLHRHIAVSRAALYLGWPKCRGRLYGIFRRVSEKIRARRLRLGT